MFQPIARYLLGVSQPSSGVKPDLQYSEDLLAKHSAYKPVFVCHKWCHKCKMSCLHLYMAMQWRHDILHAVYSSSSMSADILRTICQLYACRKTACDRACTSELWRRSSSALLKTASIGLTGAKQASLPKCSPRVSFLLLCNIAEAKFPH